MPQFEISTYPSQIFWLILCFVFLCTIMTFYLVPRLRRSIENRAQRLHQDLEQAKFLRDQEEHLRKENIFLLAQAREKAYVDIHKALQEVHHNKAQRIAALDAELMAKKRKVQEELHMQGQKILNNIEPLVSQMVTVTAGKILGQPMSRIQVKQIVEDVLKRQDKIS